MRLSHFIIIGSNPNTIRFGKIADIKEVKLNYKLTN
jgi:hypothetical protein